jgi:hypothetical protein
MWLNNFKTNLKKGFFNRDKYLIQRWPNQPKVVFYGPPNVFQDELQQRLALDLGVPVISMNDIMQNVVD